MMYLKGSFPDGLSCQMRDGCREVAANVSQGTEHRYGCENHDKIYHWRYHRVRGESIYQCMGKDLPNNSYSAESYNKGKCLRLHKRSTQRTANIQEMTGIVPCKSEFISIRTHSFWWVNLLL